MLFRSGGSLPDPHLKPPPPPLIPPNTAPAPAMNNRRLLSSACPNKKLLFCMGWKSAGCGLLAASCCPAPSLSSTLEWPSMKPGRVDMMFQRLYQSALGSKTARTMGGMCRAERQQRVLTLDQRIRIACVPGADAHVLAAALRSQPQPGLNTDRDMHSILLKAPKDP